MNKLKVTSLRAFCCLILTVSYYYGVSYLKKSGESGTGKSGTVVKEHPRWSKEKQDQLAKDQVRKSR